MKYFLLFLLVLIPTASATLVDVSIQDVIQGRATFIDLATHGNVFNATSVLYNSGSVGYTARARLDVFDGDSLVFSGWSPERTLQPGEESFYPLYWFSNRSANVTYHVRYYFAHEIYRAKDASLVVFDTQTDDPFRIEAIHTYDDRIRFVLASDRDVGDVYILPSSPLGWIIEEGRLSSIRPAAPEEISLPYSAGIYYDRPITISVVSSDGRFFHQQTVLLKREVGLEALFSQWFGRLFRA